MTNPSAFFTSLDSLTQAIDSTIETIEHLQTQAMTLENAQELLFYCHRLELLLRWKWGAVQAHLNVSVQTDENASTLQPPQEMI